jgi:KUP system potassium uptake protein
VQLGFLPRLTIRHTSARQIGQIYTPAINAYLFVAVLAIVIGFGSSTALASAYGVAVTGTFILSTVLFLAVARLLWHRPWWLIALGAAVFLTVEFAFFAANLTKVARGGWLPLAIAFTLFAILMTWRKGRGIVTTNRRMAEGSLRDFIEGLDTQGFPIRRVPGVGVFLNPDLRSTPFAFRANVERNHILHDHVIIVSVRMERVAHLDDSARVVPEARIMFSGATGDPLEFAADIAAVTLRFGFLDEPDVPSALRLAVDRQLIEPMPDVGQATYFLSESTIVPTRAAGMATWRKKLYVTLARNAASPAEYFRLPDNQTVTMNWRIQL